MKVNLTTQELAICINLVMEHKRDKFIDTSACNILINKLQRAFKESKTKNTQSK